MKAEVCGAGAPARETLETKTDSAKASAMSGVTRPWNVLVAALREIFDESAYSRFLDRRRVASSPAAYGEFLRENEVAKARRPRCC